MRQRRRRLPRMSFDQHYRPWPACSCLALDLREDSWTSLEMAQRLLENNLAPLPPPLAARPQMPRAAALTLQRAGHRETQRALARAGGSA